MVLLDTGDTSECKHLDLLYIFSKITHFISDSLDSKIQRKQSSRFKKLLMFFKSFLF